MKYINTLLLTLFVAALSAQSDSYVLKMKPVKCKDNYRAARTLDQVVREALETDYQFSYMSSLELKTIINTGKAHLIEGMDVKATGKPVLEFHVSDKNTKEKDVFKYETQLSANTTADLASLLVQAFSDDLDQQSKLIAFVKSFVDKNFATHCDTYRKKIESLNAAKKYKESLKLLVNFAKSKCDAGAGDLLSSTLKLQSDEVCATKMQQASIMVNSGVQFQMKRAIPILLSISPNATCAEEAINLSKVIGEKMGSTSQYSIDLSQYRKSRSNVDAWEAYYLQQLMNQ